MDGAIKALAALPKTKKKPRGKLLWRIGVCAGALLVIVDVFVF